MHEYFDRKGGFALVASPQAVRLLHDLGGAPTVLGDVSFSDPLLMQKMVELLTEARRLSLDPVTTTVVIPREYVFFQHFDGNFSVQHHSKVVDGMIEDKGLRRDEVSISCVSKIDMVVLAMVEMETLLEASSFAKIHGFAISRYITHARHDLNLPTFVFQPPNSLF